MIRACGLASLVTAGTSGLIATPLPMILDDGELDSGVLYGHIARANPQWREQPQQDGLVIFPGPDAYISPSWYPSKARDSRVVPTWNYVAVHAYGPVEFFDDPERLLRVVTRLTDLHEGDRENRWSVSDAPEEFIHAQLRGIVGIRMPIVRLEAKRKMGQNRSAEDRAGVVSALNESASEGDREVARLVPE